MKIGQDKIAELQGRLDIEEVVGDYVSLKRKGRNLWACCPFHDEKSPSFSVAPDKGIYKCFGCGKAGDSINFVMEIESLGFMEAVKQLAEKYGIELPEEEPEPQQLQEHQEKESLYIVLKFAADYFQELLQKHPDGKSIGYSYLKERGFSDAIIQKFELGYSTDAWDGLLKAATEKGFSLEMLEKAGLIIRKEKEDKTYDRFRGRVMFPIHNPSGKPIAFGARLLGTDKKQPKYLNSPETPVYHKSNVLYGMHLAKKSIRQHDNCYLVEGYTDVISLHISGIENVVASSGTSLTVEQIRLISRYSKHITVLYDGDPAGLKASLRGIDLILEGGLQARVVVFPDGEDPDSYSRKVGSTAFTDYLQQKATDFVVFKTKLLLKEAGTDPLRRTEVAREVLSSVALLEDAVAQSVYVKECSTLLNIDEAVLAAELNKMLRRRQQQQQPHFQQTSAPFEEYPPYEESMPQQAASEPQKATTVQESLILQEKEGIRLLLRYGFKNLSENLLMQQYLLTEVAELEFQTPVYREILDIYRQHLQEGKVIDDQYLLQQGSPEVRQVIADLSIGRYELSDAWQERHNIYTTREEDHLDKAALQYVVRHKFRFIRTLIRENQQQLHTVTNPEEVNQILLVHQELKKAEMELAALLGNVIVG